MILFITCSDIAAGEPLWLDYGQPYWDQKLCVIDLTSIEENDDDTASKDTQLAQASPPFQRDTAVELHVIDPPLPGTSSARTSQRPGNIPYSDLLTEDETGTERETGSWKQPSPATTESGSSSFDTRSGRTARTIFCQEAGCPPSRAKGFRGFARKEELNRHMKTQHGADKPKIKRKMAEKRPSTKHTVATKKLKKQPSASVKPKEQLRAMQQEADSSSSSVD